MTVTSKTQLDCTEKCKHNNPCFYNNFKYPDGHIDMHTEPHRCKVICLGEFFTNIDGTRSTTGYV